MLYFNQINFGDIKLNEEVGLNIKESLVLAEIDKNCRVTQKQLLIKTDFSFVKCKKNIKTFE